MKNYNVTLFLVKNPLRDADLELPELTPKDFNVSAKNPSDALQSAISKNDTGLSVFEHCIDEIGNY